MKSVKQNVLGFKLGRNIEVLSLKHSVFLNISRLIRRSISKKIPLDIIYSRSYNKKPPYNRMNFLVTLISYRDTDIGYMLHFLEGDKYFYTQLI